MTMEFMPKITAVQASEHHSFRLAYRAVLMSASALALCAASSALQPALAQTVWYGTNSSNWFGPSNWNPASVPDANTDTYIAVGDPNNQPVIDGLANPIVGLTRDIHIGFDGANPSWGVLTIQNGGRLDSSRNGFVGYSAVSGAEARVIVTDTGSQWNLTSGTLTVGQSYEGTLTIRDGGQVNSSYGTLGFAANGVGIIDVWGTGSEWNVTNELRIGRDGEGKLTIADSGKVSSESSRIGSLTGSSGVVTVAGSGSRWTVANDIDLGWGGKGFLTVSHDGEVEIVSGLAALNVATITGSEGTINIGAASGHSAVEAGTLNVPRVAFGGGDGTLVFNHTNTSYAFNADIDGNGTILHEAGETIYTGTGGLFSGETKVSGGRLLVNGLLGGMTTVNGGVLGGSGELLDVVVDTGGTLAPGNSIGVLTADNATFNAGSVFEVELNDGGDTKGVNNDLLDLTGGAGYLEINGGTLHVKPEIGPGSTYTPGLIYTIIEANDRAGEFDEVIDDFPLLSFTDIYSGANVYLQSAAAATCPGGMTFNQTNTCGGVLSVGSGGMYNAVVNLTSSELPEALDQVSGEIHASVKGALIEDSRFPREAANARVRSTFGAVAPGATPVLAYGDDGKPAVVTDSDYGAAFWGQGFGSFANWDGDGNAADMRRATGGFLLGADGFVADTFSLGFLGGYSQSSIDVDARNSTATADNWHLGVYGGGEWDGFGLRGGGVYSWHDIETGRSVGFRSFSDSLNTSYSSSTTQIFAETGYRFDAGAVSFEPYAGIAHVRHATNGYSESGGEASLTSAHADLTGTFSTLGLRAETEIKSGGDATARLTGSIGWRHAFGKMTPETTHSFAGGDNFTVAGVPIARNALALELGAAIALSDTASLGVSYSGQIASNTADHGIKLDFAVEY